MAKTISPSAFHKALHVWYRKHGRKKLPWRNTDDPYAIYISEIMLQQTQVKTVLERFYHPFLTRFPTLRSLADADIKDVLKCWQGLGYYNRAGNLHRTAKLARSGLPRTVEALLALPGIGRNTAHAIAAFAYRTPVPVMEANVKRVLSRIYALRSPSEQELWEKAEALLDTKNPFDYNQAMMDVGSLVCTRRNPDCPACPAHIICKGQTAPENYPAAKIKKSVPVRTRFIAVKRNAKGQFHATARAGKFLKGLYGFAESEKKPLSGKYIGSIRQQYSHFTLEAEIYLQPVKGSGKNWYGINALHALPHSGAEEKILQLLKTVKY